jgi:hypothetical protein
MSVVLGNIGQKIESDGVFQISRIEITEVIGPSWGNVVQHFFGKVPMGINESNSMSQGDVLDDHVSEEGGLAGASFANDVDMLSLVHLGYAKRIGLPPFLAFADGDV